MPALQGLNITFLVSRRTVATDSIGGATYTAATVISGVSGRLGNASRGAQQALHEAGYETLRAHQIVAQPASLNVRENDLITITGGLYNGDQFLVRLVRKDNLLPADSRSHVELLVERYEEARANP